jgi:hypothetical protein
MSKAEDRAIEKYPIEMYEEVGWRCVDKNTHKRQYFIEGYHQAEKDLALTWEDMREIYCITLNLREHLGASVFGEPLYQEVLKRFKAKKNVEQEV